MAKFKINRAIMSVAFRTGFHWTNVNPEIIKSNGFHRSGTGGFTLHIDPEIARLYMKYVPSNPCFVSNPEFKSQFDTMQYRIQIDLTGMNLFPDFSHLIDLGAYFDEDLDADDGSVYFWWKDRDIESLDSQGFPALKEYLEGNGGYIYPNEFSGDDSWNLIGTACVNGNNLTKDRIISWVKIAGDNEVVTLVSAE